MFLSSTLLCLALAIYHEARGESYRGKVAVAHVIMNRAEMKEKNACEVLKESGQFSFVKNGRAPRPRETKEFSKSLEIAETIVEGTSLDPTKGSTNFWAVKTKEPEWAPRCRKKYRIGNHIFCSIPLPSDRLE